jgi:LuxR family maltose regulon positive regulatory protein
MCGMGRSRVLVTDSNRALLIGWIRAGTTPQRVARRARIVLMAAEPRSAAAIARTLGISARTATLWPKRYAEGGPGALWRDAPGRGRPTVLSDETIARARHLLADAPPAGGRWTIRRLAATLGLSRSSVQRLIRQASSRAMSTPHRAEDAGGPSAA